MIKTLLKENTYVHLVVQFSASDRYFLFVLRNSRQ